MTKLEAVNEILEAIMEAPVAALDTGESSPEGLAEAMLDRVSKRVQAKGWHENTDYDLTLPRPTTTLTVSSVVGTFTVNETVTGDSSGATGKFYQIDTSDLMWLHTVSGTFTDADSLTGGTSGATADVDAVATVTEGQIVLEDDILKVDGYGVDAELDIAVRGRKLYKPKTQTFVFDSDVVVEAVRLLDFTDLSNPELVAAIVGEAAQVFQRRYIGGRTQDSFLGQETYEKRSSANKMDAQNQDLNILDTRTARQILGRSNTFTPRR